MKLSYITRDFTKWEYSIAVHSRVSNEHFLNIHNHSANNKKYYFNCRLLRKPSFRKQH